MQAAVQLADNQGLDAFTMRRLGEQMGVKAMALYRYVASREALLDAMTAAMMDVLHQNLLVNARQSRSAAGYLQQAGQDMRSLALPHPWLVRLTVLRPPPVPGLSAPLHSLACTEAFLDALEQHGYDAPSRVRTYRSFCAFLVEHLLAPSFNTGMPTSTTSAHPVLRRPPRNRPVSTKATAGSRASPNAELLAVHDDPAEFDHSLHSLLHALGQSRAADPGSTPITRPHPTIGRPQP